MRGSLLAALLLWSTATAAPVDDLTAALRRARTHAARGTAEIQVLFPPREPPTRMAGALPTVPFRPALLERNFTVTARAAPPLAGREVTRYDLTPAWAGAAHWTLWIDREWQVPLAFEERRPDGALARRAAFSRVGPELVARQVKVPPIPPGLRAAVLGALPGLKFPPGFVPTGVSRKPRGLDITLSDGANVLALVLASRGVRAAPGVASRRVGPGFVWLVGNLPDAALREALAGVRAVDGARLGTFVALPDSKK